VSGRAKPLLILVIMLAVVGGGVYYWVLRAPSSTPEQTAQTTPQGQKAPGGGTTAPKPKGAHPLAGETVEKEQPFFESDYGFSMVVPAGWRVVEWTDPVAPEPGKRRPAYKIRLEDPKTKSLLDFACYPFTEKSRSAVEEIFISKINAPVPGYELDIQMDEVVKEGDMRIRRAEQRTTDASGTTGLLRTFYYLSNDKLYTFSLIGTDASFSVADSPVAKVLNDIKILG
jgi:hypothetical protein